MWFTAVAVAAGTLLGILLGGKPSNLAGRTINAWGLLAAGVALQWVPELTGMTEAGALPFVAGSYSTLVLFALANLHLVGMPVVLVGLALNIAVIAPNGGMPVRAEAMRAVGFDGDPEEVDFGAKRHLEEPDDRLTVLGDIIPVEPLGEVLSFGDLILAAGMANLIFRLLRPRHGASHRLGAGEEIEGGGSDAEPAAVDAGDGHDVVDLREPASTATG